MTTQNVSDDVINYVFNILSTIKLALIFKVTIFKMGWNMVIWQLMTCHTNHDILVYRNYSGLWI